MNDLVEARKNVDRIKSEYKNEPQLLNFYLPSAERLVELLTPKK